MSRSSPARGRLLEAPPDAVHRPGLRCRAQRLLGALTAYNAVNSPPLSPEVGWTPTLFRRIDPTQAVPVLVGLFAGAGRIPG